MKSLLAALLLFSTSLAGADSLSLPFSGRWFVAQAGDTPNVNHHMSSPAQAYGVDFAKVGGPNGRELTRRKPTTVEDFYSWDETVLAPADGIVTAVVAHLPDNPLGSKDLQNPAGNHIVIRVDQGQYVFLAHLKQNTTTIGPGERVRRAQPLGLCGNSGNSDFPHVHLHVQDTATLGNGTGQNPIFGPSDVELTGKQFEAVTWPLINGLFVSNARDPTGQQTRFLPSGGSLAALSNTALQTDRLGCAGCGPGVRFGL